MKTNNHLLLYDGVCHLCNNTVQFILKNEASNLTNFASLQSKFGTNLCEEYKINPLDVDSIIYFRNSRLYTKSTAALWLCLELKFPYNLLAGLIIFPEPIRNFVYDYVAKNRYKWFGKSDSCILPNEKYKSRFLDV